MVTLCSVVAVVVLVTIVLADSLMGWWGQTVLQNALAEIKQQPVIRKTAPKAQYMPMVTIEVYKTTTNPFWMKQRPVVGSWVGGRHG